MVLELPLLEFRMDKSECYSPNGNYGDRPDDCPIGTRYAPTLAA